MKDRPRLKQLALKRTGKDPDIRGSKPVENIWCLTLSKEVKGDKLDQGSGSGVVIKGVVKGIERDVDSSLDLDRA